MNKKGSYFFNDKKFYYTETITNIYIVQFFTKQRNIKLKNKGIS